MARLVNCFKSVVRRLTPEEMKCVVAAFNDDPKLRRCRNRTPRTDLMIGGLKGSPFEQLGLVAQAVESYRDEIGGKGLLSFERYVDIGLDTGGDWWNGDLSWELIVEVENNWSELRGTMRDLMAVQARRKWAIFYHNDLGTAALELDGAVLEVRSAFQTSEFIENPATPYEVVVLPSAVDATLVGVPVVQCVFTSSDLPASINSVSL